MKIKIVAWNINQRSKTLGFIPKLVLEEITKQKANIIILTEYVKNSNHLEFCTSLESLGFQVFLDGNLVNGNQVLIAIQKSLTSEFEVHVLPKSLSYPDFLHVTIKNGKEKFHIIGTRIKIGSPPKKLSYKENQEFQINDANERMQQINILVDYLKKLEGNICIAGDFNNYFYTEESKINSWQHDLMYLQNYYSYPLLVEKMSKIYLTNHTPHGETNKVYSWANKSVHSVKKFIRNDHIFTNLNVLNKEYYWGFLNSEDYSDKIGYPDHAMLVANIII